MSSLFWFIAVIFFIIVELVSPALLSIWFALAALIVLVVSCFITNALLEFGIFAVLSMILVIITRPIYNKYFKKSIISTNVYSIIGNSYILEEAINKKTPGKIKINDQIWNAISYDGTNIKEGEEVIVDNIVGTKLVVRKKD